MPASSVQGHPSVGTPSSGVRHRLDNGGACIEGGLGMSSISRGRNFRVSSDGAYETTARGLEVLETPFLNKGSAFTLEERRELGLGGLLPSAVTNIDLQAERSYAQYRRQP